MFEQESAEAEKEYGVKTTNEGGQNGWLNLKEGKNRLRILAGGSVLANHFVGGKYVLCVGIPRGCPYHGTGAILDKEGKEIKPSLTGVFYCLNKETADDNKIYLVKLPYSSVVSVLDKYTKDTENDFYFENFPMPYDIVITYDKKALPKDKYKVEPTVKRVEVSQEILSELVKKKPTKDIATAMKERAAGGTVSPSGSSTGAADEEVEINDLDNKEIDVNDLPF